MHTSTWEFLFWVCHYFSCVCVQWLYFVWTKRKLINVTQQAIVFYIRIDLLWLEAFSGLFNALNKTFWGLDQTILYHFPGMSCYFRYVGLHKRPNSPRIEKDKENNNAFEKRPRYEANWLPFYLLHFPRE